ncbi:MAG: hypothetical protein HZA14_12520 [Nitrospirae bacterium]|nr:hypothetical protein [Nitrospirota bacterium]
MNILHLINDKQTELSRKIIDMQSKEHRVKIIELPQKNITYETIIDEIFSHDRVVSW